MNIRIGLLKCATFLAVAAAVVMPVTTEAQVQAPAKNRGQLVKAVMQVNNAQLAFAKKLAEDAQFAAQFDQAAGTGNYDAAATLAAAATGLSKSSISLSGGAPGSDHHNESAGGAPTPSSYQLVSFSRTRAATMETSGTICFDAVIVRGCIKW